MINDEFYQSEVGLLEFIKLTEKFRVCYSITFFLKDNLHSHHNTPFAGKYRATGVSSCSLIAEE